MTRPRFIKIAKDQYARRADIVMVSHEHESGELGVTLSDGTYYPVTEFDNVEPLLDATGDRANFVEINFDVFIRVDTICFLGLDRKTGLVGVSTTFDQYFPAPLFQTPEGPLRAIGGGV
jgi:hypothetical protein